MKQPLDPTNVKEMALWARTPFANNDYLTTQAIENYWNEDDAARYGMTQAEIETALFEDAKEMYAEAVPPEYVVVSRADLKLVLEEFGWRELYFAALSAQEAHKRLSVAVGAEPVMPF